MKKENADHRTAVEWLSGIIANESNATENTNDVDRKSIKEERLEDKFGSCN